MTTQGMVSGTDEAGGHEVKKGNDDEDEAGEAKRRRGQVPPGSKPVGQCPVHTEHYTKECTLCSLRVAHHEKTRCTLQNPPWCIIVNNAMCATLLVQLVYCTRVVSIGWQQPGTVGAPRALSARSARGAVASNQLFQQQFSTQKLKI